MKEMLEQKEVEIKSLKSKLEVADQYFNKVLNDYTEYEQKWRTANK